MHTSYLENDKSIHGEVEYMPFLTSNATQGGIDAAFVKFTSRDAAPKGFWR